MSAGRRCADASHLGGERHAALLGEQGGDPALGARETVQTGGHRVGNGRVRLRAADVDGGELLHVRRAAAAQSGNLDEFGEAVIS